MKAVRGKPRSSVVTRRSSTDERPDLPAGVEQAASHPALALDDDPEDYNAKPSRLTTRGRTTRDSSAKARVVSEKPSRSATRGQPLSNPSAKARVMSDPESPVMSRGNILEGILAGFEDDDEHVLDYEQVEEEVVNNPSIRFLWLT